jgi:hypothetical protein
MESVALRGMPHVAYIPMLTDFKSLSKDDCYDRRFHGFYQLLQQDRLFPYTLHLNYLSFLTRSLHCTR